MEEEKKSKIKWELPEGFECTWVEHPKKVTVKEEYEDGSYRYIILEEKKE